MSELACGCAGCTGVYLGVFEHLSVDESPSEFESACMSIGGFPDLGIELVSLMCPALADGFFTSSTTWEAQEIYLRYFIHNYR